MKGSRLLSTFLVASALFAGVIARPVQDMAPPAELKNIDWILGTWTGVGKGMGISGEAKITSEAKLAKDLDGRWINYTATYTMEGMGTLSGRMMLTYDENLKKYTGWWFDSMSATVLDLKGDLKDGVLTLEDNEVSDPMMGDTAYKIIMKKTSTGMDLQVMMKAGDQWVVAAEQAYTAKK